MTRFAIVFVVLGAATSAFGWGGGHRCITQAAMELLPAEDLRFLGAERTALEDIYCKFPDENWPCYGQWGGGVGDPRLPRYPDTRREWEISYYCGWDPVLRTGKSYPHAPPASAEAAAVLFSRAVAELRQGHREDGLRILGAMLHYVQDSGSFPHVQPIHRSFDVKQPAGLCAPGYRPQQLGQTPQAAAAALTRRVLGVVEWTERRLAPLWQETGVDFAEARRLAARQTMPPALVERWTTVRVANPAEHQAAAVACAGECTRACADVIHTALSFALRTAPPTASRGNLVFNAGLEIDDGSRAPDGWCIGYLDLADPLGRAELYRARTHFERHTHQGEFSVLLLRTPAAGLEWRPTWRRAIRVEPGQTYRGSAWVETRAATGSTCLALQFYDAAYRPLSRVQSTALAGDTAWRQVSVVARVPDGAQWLRPVLYSRANAGAAWFDDVEVERVAGDARDKPGR